MIASQSLRQRVDAHSRRGHCVYESGHHGELWIDLDAMLADERLLTSWADDLAEGVRGLSPQVVCGPMSGGALVAQKVASQLGTDFVFTDRDIKAGDPKYRLPTEFHAVVAGRRILLVDDAINAGSAIRATLSAVMAAGGIPIGMACLLALNDQAQRTAKAQRMPLRCLLQVDFPLWDAASCPTCQNVW